MTSTLKPDMSYLPTFNDVGGRPNEKRGTRGCFTLGVRIMLGGVRRNVPLETKINPGTQGGFSPGIKTFSGGSPRDVPIATKIDPGQVLFVSSTLEPDMSGEARTNAVRLSERLGSREGFTRGVRLWLGGVPRNIPVDTEIPHGEVLFVSSKLQPDLSWEGETNVIGGRDDERRGRMGSFEHGVVEAAGGPLHMPSHGNPGLWHEFGQTENKFRRCGPSHFVAGVSILPGGMPMYTLGV